MPANQPAKSPVHLGESDALTDLAEYIPPATLTAMLAQEHLPAIKHSQTLVAPFNLHDYLHRLGQLMVDFLTAGFSNRRLYELLTKEQAHPIPVSYRSFNRGLALFRQQKGLPPTRVCPPRSAAADFDITSIPRARAVAVTTSPLTPPNVLNPSLLTSVAPVPIPSSAAPATSATPPCSPATQEETLSPQEQETRELMARVATRFRPFTAEDAKHGKPAAEAIADHQRAELAAYERSLKDGTAADW